MVTGLVSGTTGADGYDTVSGLMGVARGVGLSIVHSDGAGGVGGDDGGSEM